MENGKCSTSCSMTSHIFYGDLLEFTHVDVVKLHAILEKLNNIFVVDLKWQHQWTFDSFSKSTYISWDKIFLFLTTYDIMFILYIWKNTYFLICFLFHIKCLVIMTKRHSLSYCWICDTLIIQRFSHFPNMWYLKGRSLLHTIIPLIHPT